MNQNYLKELESILEEKLSKKYNTKIKVIVRKNEDEITIIYGNDKIKNENFFKEVSDITNKFLKEKRLNKIQFGIIEDYFEEIEYPEEDENFVTLSDITEEVDNILKLKRNYDTEIQNRINKLSTNVIDIKSDLLKMDYNTVYNCIYKLSYVINNDLVYELCQEVLKPLKGEEPYS